MDNCWISCQVMTDMEKAYDDLIIINLYRIRCHLLTSTTYYLLSSGSTLRTQQTKIFDRKQGTFCSRTIEYILSTLGISRFFVKFTMHDFLINSCLYFSSFFIKFSSTQYSSFNTIQDLVTFEVGSYYFYIMLIDYSMHLELIG